MAHFYPQNTLFTVWFLFEKAFEILMDIRYLHIEIHICVQFEGNVDPSRQDAINIAAHLVSSWCQVLPDSRPAICPNLIIYAPQPQHHLKRCWNETKKVRISDEGTV